MKESKKNNIFFKGTVLIVTIFILITIIFPLVIWLIYHLFSYGIWYGVLASFLGGAISGIATIIAIYLTLQQNAKNNKEMVNLQLDLKRVDVIPYINIKVLSKDDFVKSLFSNKIDKQYDISYKNKHPSGYFVFENHITVYEDLDYKYKNKLSSGIEIGDGVESSDGKKSTYVQPIYANNTFEQPLKLTNVGLGPAINVKLDLYNSNDELIQDNIQLPFNFIVNDEAFFRLVFICYPEGKYYFKFSMTDIYGKNYYCQKYNFEYKVNQFIYGNIESPKPIEDYN
jgi:hypothetical protein